MYAVIRAGGKQYRVSPGDTIKVEKMTAWQDNVSFALFSSIRYSLRAAAPKTGHRRHFHPHTMTPTTKSGLNWGLSLDLRPISGTQYISPTQQRRLPPAFSISPSSTSCKANPQSASATRCSALRLAAARALIHTLSGDNAIALPANALPSVRDPGTRRAARRPGRSPPPPPGRQNRPPQ